MGPAPSKLPESDIPERLVERLQALENGAERLQALKNRVERLQASTSKERYVHADGQDRT